MTTLRPVYNLDELKAHVTAQLARNGPLCSLNHLDVSGLTDFTGVFLQTNFNGDVSQWNMSKATKTRAMFAHCPFTGDLSMWKMPALVDASYMFSHCRYAGDLSNWALPEGCTVQGLVGREFAGALPRPSGGREEDYHPMIGARGLPLYFTDYATRVGLNPTTAACMMAVSKTPAWAHEDDYAWVQNQKKFGKSLGLNGEDLLQMVVRNVRLQNNQDRAVAFPELASAP